MTTPERGLFERILEFVENNTDGRGQLWNDEGLRQICEVFERRLAEAETACALLTDDLRNQLRITAAKEDERMEAHRQATQLRTRCGELEGLLKTKNSALQTFGRHYESCRSILQINSKWGACSCGFDAAYDAAPAAEGPKP